jgi:hypothetical protein
MQRQPIFAGLVVDEANRPAGTAYVGDEPCYVVDDSGFLRHIPSEQVDRQVLEVMRKQISGNEGLLGEQAAKMLGTEDIFSKAMLINHLKNIDQQFENLLQTGIPEESRAYMGMSGFRVIINIHGEVVRLDQPSEPDKGEDDGD